MSDVDKTISGLDDGEHFNKTQQQTSAPSTITGEFDLTTKSSNFKYNPQQHPQHQQHLHSYQHQHHHQQQQQQQQHFQQQHQQHLRSLLPQQQHQQQQSLNYYKSITAGSVALTDSTVAEVAATTTTASNTALPPSTSSCTSSSSSSCRSNCISRILKLIFSTPGLVLLVVVYSVLGALIFPLLEAPQDITKSAAIAKSREDCLRELWIITEKLNVLYERNWTMLVHEQLRRFEGSIVAATRNGGGASGMISATPHSTAIGRFGGSLDAWEQPRWTFSEALLYSVTVITTIGHGSLTPKTAAGKLATIFYALIGVPLMLMCLSSLGALLAEALQCTYARVCCRLATHDEHGNGRTRMDNHPHQHNHHHHNHEGVKTQGHCSSKENDKNKSQRDNETECHGKGQGLNCKGCKYDALMSETNLRQSYDYNETNSGSNCTLELGRTDESSRLLHNSPKGRMHQQSNSNSPCMQLKMMMPQQQIQIQQQQTATLKQHYQHHHHQQQHQQQQKSMQPPDVMLLAAPQIIPATTQAATAMGTATATNVTRSTIATHSPQPLQATTTFHIVSNATSPQLISSTHSSPIHYNNAHAHHHLQQQQQHNQQPHQLTMRQHVPQHFVAIPSSMVRFQVAASPPSSSSASTKTQLLPPNCYQPTASASVTATTSPAAAATIYFPIAGATATMPRTASTSIVGASATQLLCNQPLVKYHTIQLQHKKPSTAIAQTTTTAAATTVTTTASTTVNILNGEQQQHQEQQSSSTSGSLGIPLNEVGPLNVADTLPLPPPPAYQTATVHGVRRAKFITRPMPPEINTILAESDVNTTTSYRNDLSVVEQQNNMAAEQTTNSTPSTTTQLHNGGGVDNVLLLSTGNGNSNGCYTTATNSMPSPSPTPLPSVAHNLTTASTTSSSFAVSPNLTDSNATVDIMADEEEDERMGNCPHGTPSRVPLLSASNDRDYDKTTMTSTARGLINAKAVAFNRHTFQQRSNNNRLNRKSTLVTQHNGGNLQTSAIWMRRSSCGGLDPFANDTATNSEDDEHFAMTQFRKGNGNISSSLTHMSVNGDDDDCVVSHGGAETDDDELDQCDGVGASDGPQVPISIVLLILLCYISLGTVIFALWENWSLVDGAYFCFVTLATIGYGDFLPERTFQGPEVQLFACCAYLLLGLVLVAMSFSILETQLMWKCKRIAVRLRLAKD